MSRVYELVEGNIYSSGKILKWGVSRYGTSRDEEMENAVWAKRIIGKHTCYVSWAPRRTRFKSPKQMQAHRLRNMQKRVGKFPLFAGELEKEELERDKFSLAACERDRAAKVIIEEQWIKEFWQRHSPGRQVWLSGEEDKRDL